MSKVSPKKHLGQHFLVDQNIAMKIVDQLTMPEGVQDVLEIGPGMGVLTQYLLQHKEYRTTVVDIDRESIAYLKEHFPQLEDRIISADFLKTDLSKLFPGKFAIIGNFPYNISSQIFFTVLKYRDVIPEVVCMIQKEVAERIAAPPGSKTYGILSVLLQAFYKIEYNFTVHEHVFHPPPKVKSGVISLIRNEVKELPCNEKLFFEVVKLSFGTRRKTLRNCLKSYNLPPEIQAQPVFDKRAEQLSVQDFIALTQLVEQNK
ncbi:16S rRNA (adenine(1518)-N(6)/adenine(1519)-N(6))-dimethyltransferase RsmA [Pontibacter sp. KCTC 32443]|uniref:16S rRNA (adenine(1518)-N(6)/adenine(1519)-N(6))- dimethyltransferase RsmA n=1 Tax=Pontibacter TaxID=323449 RepID=UPI00164E5592|nr:MULTISPECIES: 16S rRNA (adenine(1518)-N(6)/adenine(1519)-N(6))-dimethyltransferase RsmA [Pontibacter]MBC5774963.1 16S rRNA (adenine(1518)-N(6)/adenine(1519)-N(6))-dimethyltransferase RsmA [Pontibacter sp. KCTC 32443]